MPTSFRDKMNGQNAIALTRKIIIALGVSLLFALFAIMPMLGYSGEADIEVERQLTGFTRISVDFKATFSPFLYPFTWVTGYGTPSGFLQFISPPIYGGYGEIKTPVRLKESDFEDEAWIRIVLSEAPANIPWNFAIVLALELVKERRLYFCLLGGVFGFPLAGIIGAVVGFFAGIVLMLYVLPIADKNSYTTRIKHMLLGEA